MLYSILKLFVHADEYVFCGELLELDMDILHVESTSKCHNKMGSLNSGIRIGEYSKLNGGKFGENLSIGSFTALGNGVVTGSGVRIGNSVCIGNGVQLKNKTRVDDETAIHIVQGKQKLLPRVKGQRYALRNGQCKLEKT